MKPHNETWFYKREKDANARMKKMLALGFPTNKSRWVSACGSDHWEGWMVTLQYKQGKDRRSHIVKCAS